MTTYEVMLERDTANDVSAIVSAVLVLSGTAVAKDQPIFEIENSKATEEHLSPGQGILLHELVTGQTVDFGVVIAQVVSPAEAAARAVSPPVLPPAPQAVLPPAPPPVRAPMPLSVPVLWPAPALPVTTGVTEIKAGLAKTRFSLEAARLLNEFGLATSQFDTDFVTADDVRAHVAWQSATIESLLPKEGGKTTEAVTGTGTAVGQRKRAEIETLAHGPGQTMLSVLGVSLGPLTIRRKQDDFLAGKIIDLVLYEAARLMRKYPRLNGHYVDGKIYLHEAVHAGMAIDDGGRLMVFGHENADETDLTELGYGIADAVARYVSGQLTTQELTRATFTVTDLSAGELDFVLPLLPRGQSCIIGITASTKDGYRLFAGFDHRVTEGREVMSFLGELRERLLSFSSSSAAALDASVCGFCARSAKEAVSSSKEKGLLKLIGREGLEVLCCGSCWNGW